MSEPKQPIFEAHVLCDLGDLYRAYANTWRKASGGGRRCRNGHRAEEGAQWVVVRRCRTADGTMKSQATLPYHSIEPRAGATGIS